MIKSNIGASLRRLTNSPPNKDNSKGGSNQGSYNWQKILPIGGVALTVAGYIAMWCDDWCKLKAVDNKIKNGSRPSLNADDDRLIDRQEVVDKIINTFINQEVYKMFGVILGPTGTGKTADKGSMSSEQ